MAHPSGSKGKGRQSEQAVEGTSEAEAAEAGIRNGTIPPAASVHSGKEALSAGHVCSEGYPKVPAVDGTAAAKAAIPATLPGGRFQVPEGPAIPVLRRHGSAGLLP